MKKNKELQKVTEDFFKTLVEVWLYFESEKEDPYPFDLWLEDLNDILSDHNHVIYQDLYWRYKN